MKKVMRHTRLPSARLDTHRCLKLSNSWLQQAKRRLRSHPLQIAHLRSKLWERLMSLSKSSATCLPKSASQEMQCRPIKASLRLFQTSLSSRSKDSMSPQTRSFRIQWRPIRWQVVPCRTLCRQITLLMHSAKHLPSSKSTPASNRPSTSTSAMASFPACPRELLKAQMLSPMTRLTLSVSVTKRVELMGPYRLAQLCKPQSTIPAKIWVTIKIICHISSSKTRCLQAPQLRSKRLTPGHSWKVTASRARIVKA